MNEYDYIIGATLFMMCVGASLGMSCAGLVTLWPDRVNARKGVVLSNDASKRVS